MAKKTTAKKEYQVKWLDESSFEINVSISKKEISDEYQASLRKLAKNISLPGFRKGKAPDKQVEQKLGKDTIYQEVINKIIPQKYQDILNRENIQPIIEPQISLESAKENQDWQIKIMGCIAPKVNLNNFREEIRKITAKSKIWTPQKENQELNEEKKSTEKQLLIQEILKKLVEIVEVKIPSVLVETQVQKKLVSLIDQLQDGGLTLNQYLSSKKQTIDQLKDIYRQQVEREWEIEFILEQIANQEKITVEQSDIDKFIQKQKDIDKKQINSYLVAHLLRRQKTLDYLLGL